jgi:hypothetical protein
MAKNPWMSLWLSAANTWAGAARCFWTAEMHRQQRAMLNEMSKPTAWPATKRSSFKKAYPGREGSPKANLTPKNSFGPWQRSCLSRIDLTG